MAGSCEYNISTVLYEMSMPKIIENIQEYVHSLLELPTSCFMKRLYLLF
jgi:hypothetical protein